MADAGPGGPSPKGAEPSPEAAEPSLKADEPSLKGPERPAAPEGSGSYRQLFDQRYWRLFRESPGAKYICTPQGNILEVNSAFCRLLGCSPQDVVGGSLSSFSMDPALPATELGPFLAGAESTYVLDRRYLTGDGRSVWARVTLGAVRDEAGRAVCVFGELEDMTARHMADHELGRQRQRLELAIEASGIAVWELDVVSGRVTVQEQGSSRAREHSMTYGDFIRGFNPDDRALLPPIRALRAHAYPEVDLELRLGPAFGPTRWVHVRGRAVRGDDGKILRMVGTTADVTEPRAQRGELAAQRDRLELALETANMMAWEVTFAPRPTFTAVHADLMGLELPGELVVSGLAGSPVFGDRVFPPDRELVRGALAAVSQSPESEIDVEYRWEDDNGVVRWAHTRARTELGPAGQVVRVSGTTADVTATRREVAARLRAERVLSRTLEASQDAFISTDHRGVITHWNPAAEVMFGWFRDEMVGQLLAERICGDSRGTVQRILGLAGASREGAAGVASEPGPRAAGTSPAAPADTSPAAPADTSPAAPADTSAERFGGTSAERAGGPSASEGATVRVEAELVTRDGRHFPAEISAVRVEDAGAAFYQLFVRDLSERKAYEAQLVRSALYDQLTGLPNRALLLDRLSGAVRRLSRVAGMAAVLFVDVDRFKRVNDSLGHSGGDEFLVELARRLRAVLRPADTVARFGADEFVVLCESLDDEREAMALALRVEGIFSAPFMIGGAGGKEVYTSASVGIVLAGSGATDAEALVRDAAHAMHRAKEHGGGHSEVFDAEIRTRSMAHAETESELRRALEHNELRVYYQPVVDLTGRLRKLEALVRWPQRSGRVALPAEFVPIAEETGLIVGLGEVVLEMACHQVCQWRTQYSGLAQLEVAVNVSSAQLRARDAVERMAAIIEGSGLPAEALVLEITESVLMDEKAGAAQKLAALRSLGTRLAVDDFGTGYSSLLYLRRYPLDMLKIDRSFVAGLVENPEDATIVDAVVRLGHSFGLQTVAEGVETAEQLRLLRTLGCDMGQGHFWGRPLPPENLITVILDDASSPTAGTRPLSPS